MHTACVWSEKLPFAGYSVVKDHSGGSPLGIFCGLGALPPDRSLGGLRGPREAARVQCPRFKLGGEYRARTGDLLVTNQALSQLS